MSLEDNDAVSSASHCSRINKQLNDQKFDPNEWSDNTEDKHEFWKFFSCTKRLPDIIVWGCDTIQPQSALC